MAETQHRKLAAIMFTDIVVYSALSYREKPLKRLYPRSHPYNPGLKPWAIHPATKEQTPSGVSPFLES